MSEKREKMDRGTVFSQYSVGSMNDLVARVDLLEQLHEQLVRNQKETIAYVKTSQDETMGQISELRAMIAVVTERSGVRGYPRAENSENVGHDTGMKEALSEEDQSIIGQYEVNRTALEFPVELALDKIEDSLRKSLSSPTKKESAQGQQDYQEAPKSVTTSQPRAMVESPRGSEKMKGIEKGNDQFTPSPFTYQELYSKLLHARVVAPCFVKTPSPPYPSWFREEEHCDYHAGIRGHSIEKCTNFKRKIQVLLNLGVLEFETKSPGLIIRFPTADNEVKLGGDQVDVVKEVDRAKSQASAKSTNISGCPDHTKEGSDLLTGSKEFPKEPAKAIDPDKIEESEPYLRKREKRKAKEHIVGEVDKKTKACFPMTNSELLPLLIQNKLLRPPPPKRYAYFNTNVFGARVPCEYHSGDFSHTTEECAFLKRRIYRLVENRVLSFEDGKPKFK